MTHRNTLRLCAFVVAMVHLAVARADVFTYKKRDGTPARFAGQFIGVSGGWTVIESYDGAMLYYRPGFITERKPSNPPPPITHEKMVQKLEAKFGARRIRTHIAKPFVVCLVLADALSQKGDRLAEIFLKKAGLYLKRMHDVYGRFAKRYSIPLHEPRFPLVMVIFESDIAYSEYMEKKDGQRSRRSATSRGLYNLKSNWLFNASSGNYWRTAETFPTLKQAEAYESYLLFLADRDFEKLLNELNFPYYVYVHGFDYRIVPRYSWSQLSP